MVEGGHDGQRGVERLAATCWPRPRLPPKPPRASLPPKPPRASLPPKPSQKSPLLSKQSK